MEHEQPARLRGLGQVLDSHGPIKNEGRILPDMARMGAATLQIRKMPSGGRGEYEIVGKQGNWGPDVLADRELMLRFGNVTKSTRVQLTGQGGKRRLRLLDKTFPHLARQIAMLLLLPRNARDERHVSQALPILLEDRYILDCSFDYLPSESDSEAFASIRPRILWARSGDIARGAPHELVDVDDRVTRLVRVAERTRRLPGELEPMVDAFMAVHGSSQPVGKGEEALVRAIIRELSFIDEEYLSHSDPLPRLEYLSGLSPDTVDIPAPGQISVDDLDVKRRSEHIYRLRRIRGSSATVFKKAIHVAYDSRCVVCGFRAPGFTGRMMPGVDAAHILPYGEYDLDIVSNGLALCKIHHWAFDSGILEIHKVGEEFVVKLAADAPRLLEGDERTLSELSLVCGFVPSAWLPKRRADRPSGAFLAALYSDRLGDSSD